VSVDLPAGLSPAGGLATFPLMHAVLFFAMQLEGEFFVNLALAQVKLSGKVQMGDGANTLACKAVRDRGSDLFINEMRCK